MKIVLIGGGTGGHFYPLIAVAEAIEKMCESRALIEPELYYMGPPPFDRTALLEHDIVYLPSSAGKLHRYPTFLTFISFFSTFFGVVRATFQLFSLYPDVILSTGGYASFPTLYAARLLSIPVVIYDADATPGRVSLWSSKFAKYIAVAHPDAAVQFPKSVQSKIARTGHPIRFEIEHGADSGGYEFLKLDNMVPTIFIMGGSQGARVINEAVLDALPRLVEKYNIVHQTGTDNLLEVQEIASVELKDSPYINRYRPYGLLNTLAIRMAVGITSILVARAGSGTIFETASWGVPSILIPLPLDISRDQTENAFSYARHGAAVVIEQVNLSPHILEAEIERLMQKPELRKQMGEAAKAYARPDAALKLASVLMEIAVSHQSQ